MKWKMVERTVAYQGFFRFEQLRLRHERHAGGWSEELHRDLISRAPVVAVLPYDPERDKVVLVEQFRTGAIDKLDEPWLIEIIAGLVEPGEELQEVAHREALEEAGCVLRDLVHIRDYFSTPGGNKEHVSLYAAKTDSSNVGGVHGLADEGEDIRVHVLDVGEAFEMLASGRIMSANTIIALQWLQINKTNW